MGQTSFKSASELERKAPYYPANDCSNRGRLSALARRATSIQIFALQSHLRIELEVLFLSIRTYGVIDLKLLIVLVHLELAARASLGLNRGYELCAFVLGNLAIGERRQGGYDKYCYR